MKKLVQAGVQEMEGDDAVVVHAIEAVLHAGVGDGAGGIVVGAPQLIQLHLASVERQAKEDIALGFAVVDRGVARGTVISVAAALFMRHAGLQLEFWPGLRNNASL